MRASRVGLNDSFRIGLEGFFYGVLISIASEMVLGRVENDLYSLFFKILLSSLAHSSFYVFVVSVPKMNRRFRDLISLTSVVILQLLIISVGEVLIYSLYSTSQSWKHSSVFSIEALYYGLPLSCGSLLLQLVLGIRYSLICTFSVGYLIQTIFKDFDQALTVSLATSLIGSMSLRRVRSRSAYARAGFNVFITTVLIVMIHNLSGKFIAEGTFIFEFYVQILSAMVGALLVFLVTSGFSPILEVAGGYVTDMRLLEMATLDHPLLKELSIQAPGTWNHSMVMGMMSESAADAIGANPVLAKVGSYFHDIGKSRKPMYFVENQFGGENRHDRLSPSMSALIIKSHVKDGLEMARKYSLPLVLQDMILEHHGTSTIEYFYEKALKEAESNDQTINVDRSHYQYPGPRPRTKEAGILMLADGIEAASRTLNDPSFDRIQGMVQKMINKVFASGQLDECELTLLDLHQIARCFTRVLAGIHHQRIAYSEPVEKIFKPSKESEEQALGISNQSKANQDIITKEEGLKRLGVKK